MRVVVVTVTALSLAGCSDADRPSDVEPDAVASAPTSSAPSAAVSAPWEPQPTPTPVADAGAVDVREAYRAYWDAAAAAADPPRPDSRELRRHATGAELSRIRAELAADELHDVARTGSYLTDPVVVAVDGDTATVADCFTPYLWAKGEAKPARPPAIPLTATLERSGGTWLVASTDAATHSCQTTPAS